MPLTLNNYTFVGKLNALSFALYETQVKSSLVQYNAE